MIYSGGHSVPLPWAPFLWPAGAEMLLPDSPYPGPAKDVGHAQKFLVGTTRFLHFCLRQNGTHFEDRDHGQKA
jgi:hypothetical protein